MKLWIHEKNYESTNKGIELRILLYLYALNIDREYIRKVLTVRKEKCCYALCFCSAEIIQKLLDSGELITEQNIDETIRFAIEKKHIDRL